MKRSLPLLFLIACGPTKPAEPTKPIAPETQATQEPLDDAKAKLSAQLEADAKGKAINTSVTAGPLDTQLVRAMVDGAAPMTGVRGAVVTKDGAIIGPRDNVGFAELVRARGWLAKPPPIGALIQLANYALFDGLLAFDPAVPSLSGAPDALTLAMIVVTYPSGAKDTITVTVRSTGPADVRIAAAAQEPAPASPAAELEAAIDAGDAAAISLGIQHNQRTTDPAGLNQLARATTLPNETLSANALMAMGATPSSAVALKAAWAPLTPEARAKLMAMAGELYSREFVETLR